MHIVLQNFYTTWVRGVAYQKQLSGPKLMGVWAEGARQKFGNPYLFLQPLKLTISNLIYNLSLGSTLPRTFTMKINRGPRLGKHPKIWDTLFISATVEASNFKFGIQLRLAEELAKKQLLRPKNWASYLFMKPLKLASSNWLGYRSNSKSVGITYTLNHVPCTN